MTMHVSRFNAECFKQVLKHILSMHYQRFKTVAQSQFRTNDGPAWDVAKGLVSISEWVVRLSQEAITPPCKNNMGQQCRLSVIISYYKYVQALPIVHICLTDTLQKLGINYEIIFVNDGSTKDSADVIRKIIESDSCVIVINHSRNFASQIVFRNSMELSTKKCVVLLDSDIQNSPELIAIFYEKPEEGLDVNYGLRVALHCGLMYKPFCRLFAFFSYVKILLDVGEYAAKIMAEFKGQPRFIRAALIPNFNVNALLADGKVNL